MLVAATGGVGGGGGGGVAAVTSADNAADGWQLLSTVVHVLSTLTVKQPLAPVS